MQIVTERLESTRLQLLDIYGTPCLTIRRRWLLAWSQTQCCPCLTAFSASKQRDGTTPSRWNFLPEDAGKGFCLCAGPVQHALRLRCGRSADLHQRRPATRSFAKHTTRVVGTVTKAMRQLKRGEIMGVRGPFGSHWPVEEARAGTWSLWRAESGWRRCDLRSID